MPADDVYRGTTRSAGLFERLREDAARYPDTMDERYGAWAQLLALFRLVHDGGRHGRLRLRPAHGGLFDPDRYPFLEGRPHGSRRSRASASIRRSSPTASSIRVLQNLLLLDGERLSYRALDVEQIGSVYEAMMGFDARAGARAVHRRQAAKPHGAPTSSTSTRCSRRPRRAREVAARSSADLQARRQGADALAKAATVEDARRRARKDGRAATPNVVPAGAMVLQPTEERRRSGSHYTPRSLTEPIVRTTLEPILERTRRPRRRPSRSSTSRSATRRWDRARSWSRPAASSASALVARMAAPRAACRRSRPTRTSSLHARRLVAQRCLYGVDKNPFAVDLAKLSLWLATLARDHRSLRRPRAAARRLARRPDARADRVLPLGGRGADAAARASSIEERVAKAKRCASRSRRPCDDVRRRATKRASAAAKRRTSSPTCGSSATWSSRRSSRGEAEGTEGARDPVARACSRRRSVGSSADRTRGCPR